MGPACKKLAGWLGPCENFTSQSESLLSSTCTEVAHDLPQTGMDRLLLREGLRSQPAVVPFGSPVTPPDLEQRGQVATKEAWDFYNSPRGNEREHSKVVSVSPLGSVPAVSCSNSWGLVTHNTGRHDADHLRPEGGPHHICVSLVRMAHGRLTSARFGGQLHFTDLP